VIVPTPPVEALLALLPIDPAREALHLPTALVGSCLGRCEDSVGAAVRGLNALCLRVLQQDEEEAQVLKILVVEKPEIDLRWAERLSCARHEFSLRSHSRRGEERDPPRTSWDLRVGVKTRVAFVSSGSKPYVVCTLTGSLPHGLKLDAANGIVTMTYAYIVAPAKRVKHRPRG
jgi:hypothetical protein